MDFTKKWCEFSENGDPQLFKEIYEGNIKTLCLVGYGILHDMSWAKDVAQDVFYKLFAERSKHSAVKNFASWLHVIYKNTCFRELSIKKTHDKRIRELAIPEDDYNDDDSNMYRKKLRVAIGKLKKKNFEEVISQYLEGKSNKEIAQDLNRTEKYVRDRKYLAKKELKRILGK